MRTEGADPAQVEVSARKDGSRPRGRYVRRERRQGSHTWIVRLAARSWVVSRRFLVAESRRAHGGVAEWFRQGPAKPRTPVRFRSPPPAVCPGGGHLSLR